MSEDSLFSPILKTFKWVVVEKRERKRERKRREGEREEKERGEERERKERKTGDPRKSRKESPFSSLVSFFFSFEKTINK